MKDVSSNKISDYDTARFESNYRRFIIFLLIIICAGIIFIVRDIYYRISDVVIQKEYSCIYLIGTLTAAASRLLLPVVKKRLGNNAAEAMITVTVIILFFGFVNLSLLDSFYFNAFNYTAYIFGCLMLTFLFRVGTRLILIIILGGMLYFIIAYRLVSPDIFTLLGMFPLIGISVSAFYFSFSQENMGYRLFEANESLKEKNKQLEEVALHDSLTGFHNRHYLDEFLEHQIALFNRRSNPFSIIFTDLDHFKSINDEFGHTAGDRVLQDFAEIIRRGSRDADIAFRYGGEEFLLIVTEAGLDEAAEIAERIRELTEQHSFYEIDRQVTASFGIAEVHPGDDMNSLIKRADEYLYKAKNSGRNRCCMDIA